MPPITIIDFRLPNGLHVLLAPDHSRPVVAVSMVYNVGATSDPENREGLAHLVEHLTFESGPHFRNDAWQRALSDSGGSGNGYTYNDLTQYFETLPASQIDLALALETERMRSFRVDRASLDHERSIVQAEWRQEHQTSVTDVIDDAIRQHESARGQHQRAPIGEAQALKRVTIEEAQRFFQTYYLPNNATLAIVGDFAPEQIRARVTALFGPIAAGATPPEAPIYEPDYPRGDAGWPASASSPRRVALTIDRNLPGYFSVAFPTVHFMAPDYTALRALRTILSSGYQGRLWRALVIGGQAESSYVNEVITRGIGLMTIDASTLNRAGGFAAVEATIRRVIDDLQHNGPTVDEMRRMQMHERSVQIDTHASPAAAARRLSMTAARGFDPNEINYLYPRIAAVSAADIQRVSRKYLRPDTALVITRVMR